jgi:2-aminophenol/2-amino-5-chlorophenol 1,6-dioxygenase alpha subunit
MESRVGNGEAMKSILQNVYIVPGLPHILLAPEKSQGWQSLNASFAKVRNEIEASDTELILYCSTQWVSVLGYLFQARENPEWTHVDHNWHELGSIHYKFAVDSAFAKVYAHEVHELGHGVREVDYHGFPIDTGTIVAQKLLNPNNRYKAAMASINMYAEKQECLSIGQAAMRALEKHGQRTTIVVVSGLSQRFETRDIDPQNDRISSLKDDEWNRKILEILGEGRLEDVSEVAREYSRQANADMGFKAIWWLNGLCGKTNSFRGRVFDYQPVWGTGAALVGLYPTAPIRSLANWVNDESDLVETVAKPNSSPQSTPTQVISTQVISTQVISTAAAPLPVGPYPHARREGEFLFLSGCGPRKPGTQQIPGVTLADDGSILQSDIEVQTRSVFENIESILHASGATLNDVVDVQVYLTNMKRDFATFNRVYAEYFSKKAHDGTPLGPCRTTIEVGALPTPIAVELKVTARIASHPIN